MKKFGFAVISFVVMLFIVSPSSSQSSPTEELEGTLEVLVATSLREKRCENIYYLKKGEERIRLSLPDNPPPNLSSGQRIKIVGRQDEKSFRCRKMSPITSVPVTKKTMESTHIASDYLPEQYLVSGEIKTVVAFVYFSDIPAPKLGKDKANDKIFFNKHSLTAYWEECSGGIIWLSGSDDTLEVWLEMPKKSSEYGYSSDEEMDHFKEFRNDVIELLDPYINFKNCNHLEIFRAGDNWMYDWSTWGKLSISTDDGDVEISANFLTEGDVEIKNSNAAHEFTHALKCAHSNSKSVSNGKIHGYGDWWDVRGKDGQIDSLNKWILGWLKIDQIKIITASGSFWLDQRELASGGIKLLVVVLGFDEYGNPILFYLEYHRGLGEFDSQLHFENKNEAVDPQNLVLLRKHEYVEDYSSVVYLPDDGNNCLDLESKEFQAEYGIAFHVLQKTEEDANSQAEVKITLPSGYTVPTLIPEPSPTPSPTPSPSPSPSPTLAPVCEVESVWIYPDRLTLNREETSSANVTVTLMNASGCAIEGEQVTASVNVVGKKRIAVTPTAITNESGEATFTVSAKKKLGKAKVMFTAGDSVHGYVAVKIVK